MNIIIAYWHGMNLSSEAKSNSASKKNISWVKASHDTSTAYKIQTLEESNSTRYRHLCLQDIISSWQLIK